MKIVKQCESEGPKELAKWLMEENTELDYDQWILVAFGIVQTYFEYALPSLPEASGSVFILEYILGQEKGPSSGLFPASYSDLKNQLAQEQAHTAQQAARIAELEEEIQTLKKVGKRALAGAAALYIGQHPTSDYDPEASIRDLDAQSWYSDARALFAQPQPEGGA